MVKSLYFKPPNRFSYPKALISYGLLKKRDKRFSSGTSVEQIILDRHFKMQQNLQNSENNFPSINREEKGSCNENIFITGVQGRVHFSSGNELELDMNTSCNQI